MKKSSILIFIVVLLMGAWLLISKQQTNPSLVPANNVAMFEKTQVITVTVKGGYSPKTTLAAAGTPSKIIFKTNSTFDCSSAVSIPSLNFRANLPPTGETTLEIPAQTPGSILKGSCSMGMYHFTISFN